MTWVNLPWRRCGFNQHRRSVSRSVRTMRNLSLSVNDPWTSAGAPLHPLTSLYRILQQRACIPNQDDVIKAVRELSEISEHFPLRPPFIEARRRISRVELDGALKFAASLINALIVVREGGICWCWTRCYWGRTATTTRLNLRPTLRPRLLWRSRYR